MLICCLLKFLYANPLFQVHHTFATAGSDGAFNFWDKDSKQRLKVSSDKLNSNLNLFSWFYCISMKLRFYLLNSKLNTDAFVNDCFTSKMSVCCAHKITQTFFADPYNIILNLMYNIRPKKKESNTTFFFQAMSVDLNS